MTEHLPHDQAQKLAAMLWKKYGEIFDNMRRPHSINPLEWFYTTSIGGYDFVIVAGATISDIDVGIIRIFNEDFRIEYNYGTDENDKIICDISMDGIADEVLTMMILCLN